VNAHHRGPCFQYGGKQRLVENVDWCGQPGGTGEAREADTDQNRQQGGNNGLCGGWVDGANALHFFPANGCGEEFARPVIARNGNK